MMMIKTFWDELKWIVVFSFSMMLLWSLPLVIRLIFAIPCYMFLRSFVEESGYKLVTKRLLCAVVVSLAIVFPPWG